MTRRYGLLAILLIVSAALAACNSPKASSQPEAAKEAKKLVDPVNKESDGLALEGYDAVAYFTEGKAVKGNGAYTHEWNGAKWHFASAANRDLFAQEPGKYAPQYGGHCSWAVSNNYTAEGDPEAWKIVNGKLYLNYNKEVQAQWEQDIPGRVAKADENWPGLHK